jgi:DNA-binding transcriptional MocR family regulator
VIEDDYARDLAFGSAPPAPLFRQGGDRVVYIRSLTKSTAPGLRVAGVVAKGPVLGRLRALRATEHFFVSGLLQDTALELVNAAGRGGYVQRLRQTLRERRDRAVRAIATELPQFTLTRVPKGASASGSSSPLEQTTFGSWRRRRGRACRSRLARPGLPLKGRRLSCASAPQERAPAISRRASPGSRQSKFKFDRIAPCLTSTSRT